MAEEDTTLNTKKAAAEEDVVSGECVVCWTHVRTAYFSLVGTCACARPVPNESRWATLARSAALKLR